MILLDTHIWIWFVNNSPQLPKNIKSKILESDFLCLSPISCWEVSMLESKKRIELKLDIKIWMKYATSLSNFKILDLTPEIAILSNNLTENFHQDPADRIITATALHHNIPLATLDNKIISANLIEIIN